MLIARWYGHIVDHVGAFLYGRFNPGEKVYIKVPEGLETYFPEGTVLMLLQMLYRLKQRAIQYWKEAVTDMGFSQSKSDPCLYFK